MIMWCVNCDHSYETDITHHVAIIVSTKLKVHLSR